MSSLEFLTGLCLLDTFYFQTNLPLFLVLPSVFVDRDGAVNLENALYLEGLATVGPDANSKIEHLSLSVAFVGPNSKELYANAVRNLKQALPNVKTIKLNGGYVFDPANDVSFFEFRCLFWFFRIRRFSTKRHRTLKPILTRWPSCLEQRSCRLAR